MPEIAKRGWRKGNHYIDHRAPRPLRLIFYRSGSEPACFDPPLGLNKCKRRKRKNTADLIQIIWTATMTMMMGGRRERERDAEKEGEIFQRKKEAIFSSMPLMEFRAEER